MEKFGDYFIFRPSDLNTTLTYVLMDGQLLFLFAIWLRMLFSYCYFWGVHAIFLNNLKHETISGNILNSMELWKMLRYPWILKVSSFQFLCIFHIIPKTLKVLPDLALSCGTRVNEGRVTWPKAGAHCSTYILQWFSF